MQTTITIQNGKIITTSVSSIDVAAYIEQQQDAITQYQGNIVSLQHQIDTYSQKIVDTQALIDQASQ